MITITALSLSSPSRCFITKKLPGPSWSEDDQRLISRVSNQYLSNFILIFKVGSIFLAKKFVFLVVIINPQFGRLLKNTRVFNELHWLVWKIFEINAAVFEEDSIAVAHSMHIVLLVSNASEWLNTQRKHKIRRKDILAKKNFLFREITINWIIHLLT